MLNFPDTKAKIKSRISSYKSSLNKEFKKYGTFRDGSGKRYMLFWLYFVLDDLKKFEEYIDWYNKEFPDDVGEPAQKLCWALCLRRLNKEDEAVHMLAELMLSNLYLIPQLLAEEIEEHDIWHSSNYEYPDYFEYIPAEVIEHINMDDLSWINEHHQSFAFRRMKKKYIEIYQQLKHERDIDKRRVLLDESYSIMSYLDEY